ncbi:MAG: DUF3617 domain-containing protein [Steroidobacteraceae bacterium]|jgi:hypothetical protein
MHNSKKLGTAGAMLAFIVLAHAADAIKLNVKPGLWEFSSAGQASGMPPIPDEALARLTPEQRQQFQAAMQSSMGSASKPKLFKECITPEKVAQGFDLQESKDATCQRSVVSATSSEFQIHAVCTRAEGSTTVDSHFQTSGSDQVAGTVHVVTTRAGKTMTIDSNVNGKWLGASCGNITGIQFEN